ncbi:hypothetical protein SAMN05660903_03654, partial [Salegentibacter salinarum]|uniref:hypothetical protein n=1 Tax=Salegentibacter salinarum TaxID=447422 RepID=UPI0009C66C82
MKKVLFLFVFLFLGLFVNSQNLENGLIGHWPLNGDAVDHSLGGNNGQIYGAIPVPNRFGVDDKAMYFDGKSYISFGNVLNVG